jgi:hypothetical protein
LSSDEKNEKKAAKRRRNKELGLNDATVNITVNI